MVTGYADVVADDKAPSGSDGAGEEDVEGELAGVLLALPGPGAHRGRSCHRVSAFGSGYGQISQGRDPHADARGIL